MLWNRLRPWLGVGFFLFEAIQPLLHHTVEPLIVGVAASMMVVETVAQAIKSHPEKDSESK